MSAPSACKVACDLRRVGNVLVALGLIDNEGSKLDGAAPSTPEMQCGMMVRRYILQKKGEPSCMAKVCCEIYHQTQNNICYQKALGTRFVQCCCSTLSALLLLGWNPDSLGSQSQASRNTHMLNMANQRLQNLPIHVLLTMQRVQHLQIQQRHMGETRELTLARDEVVGCIFDPRLPARVSAYDKTCNMCLCVCWP